MKMASAGVETNFLYRIYSKLVMYFIAFLLFIDLVSSIGTSVFYNGEVRTVRCLVRRLYKHFNNKNSRIFFLISSPIMFPFQTTP